MPLLLLIGLVGATTSAFSNVLMEHREDELFIHFEKAGGVRWIYDEIGESLLFMGQELQVPEGMEPLKDIVTYEDVSSVSHGIYNAFLSGNLYVFDLSVQKIRIKENVDAYFDRYIEEQSLTELMDNEFIDMELVRESYLRDAYAQLEQQVVKIEAALNAAMEGFYRTAWITKATGTEELHNMEDSHLALLRNSLKKAEFAEIGVMAVFGFLLLVCYLFHPSGFFVVGGTAVVLGAAAFAVSKGILLLPFSELLPAALIPHKSLYAVAEQIASWLSDGYLSFSICSAAAGVLMLLFGGILLLFQRNRT